MLPLVTRQDQLQTMGITLPTNNLTDSLFDGIDIPKGVDPIHWIPENSVHQAILLSKEIDTTRNFLGPQRNIVRDEVRRKTWVAYIERGYLMLAEIRDGNVTKTTLAGPNVWRSHIVLDKFTGNIRAAWIVRAGGVRTLWFDGAQVSTGATDPDFPFVALSQVPIGNVQNQASPYGMISYKDRSSGRSYRRTFVGSTLGTEQVLTASTILGGPSFTIAGVRVLARIDALVSGVIVPKTSLSTDSGATFAAFTTIDLPYGASYTPIPSPPPVTDHLGFFHVPIGITNGTESFALNVVVDESIVEAIAVQAPLGVRDKVELAAFPKKGGTTTNTRFGNGVTDGLGLIMIMQAQSRLYTSNSQAGGILFPQPAHLNYEMPAVAAYDATECYTRGVDANMVSMDYSYLEVDGETGLPLSGELYFETWDMPLPDPVLTTTANVGTVNVTISRDAHFFRGRTTFSFDDPTIEITNVVIVDGRNATVSTNASSLTGKTLRFDVSNLFYHHSGSTVVA